PIVGFMLKHCTMQGGLCYILKIDIKGCLKVQSINGLDIVRIKNRLPNSAGDFLIIGVTVLSGKLLVEAVLKSGSMLILIYKSDGPAGEIGKRHVTDINLLEDGSPSQSAFPEYRPLHHHLLLLVINLPSVYHHVLLTGFTGIN